MHLSSCMAAGLPAHGRNSLRGASLTQRRLSWLMRLAKLPVSIRPAHRKFARRTSSGPGRVGQDLGNQGKLLRLHPSCIGHLRVFSDEGTAELNRIESLVEMVALATAGQSVGRASADIHRIRGC